PETQEPQSAIRGLCNIRAIAAREQVTADSIRTVKHRRLYPLLWIGAPGVQLRPGDPHETTSRVKPNRISVIFHHPVNRVAGQSVPATGGQNAAAFDAAEAS